MPDSIQINFLELHHLAAGATAGKLSLLRSVLSQDRLKIQWEDRPPCPGNPSGHQLALLLCWFLSWLLAIRYQTLFQHVQLVTVTLIDPNLTV